MAGGADEVFRLAADLSGSSRRMLPALLDEFDAIGQDFEDDWRAAAESRYSRYGIHYPKAIDHETRTTLGGNIQVEVGPDPSMKQGGMSFERGSRNQPAHLDGLRAMQRNEAPALRRAERLIEELLT